MSQVILCPNCETEISLDKLASSKFEKELNNQKLKLQKQEEDFRLKLKQDKLKQKELFEKELDKKTKEMREKAIKYAEEKSKKEREKEREKLELEMKDMQEQLKEVDIIKERINKKELDFLKSQRKLKEKERSLDLELEKKILKEKEILEKELAFESDLKNKRLEKEFLNKQKKEQEKQSKILKEKEKELELNLTLKQEELNKKELELLKQEENKANKLKKELALKIEQSEKEQEELRKKEQEEFRKKELELLKQQEQMKRALDEAKRKAEQGSQQIQGDIQEEDLKFMLSQKFPIDSITDVPTGVKGADLVQIVNNNLAQQAGIILWESKNTKSWSNDWINKLNDDKIMAKASVAILVTKTLPKGISSFGLINGIWVTLPKYIIEISLIIREQILSINKIKKSIEGKDEKMEALYGYLSSEEFGGKVDGIISSFKALKDGIETEKRAMNRIWSKREKELERVINNTSMMYGDLEGIIGNSLAPVEYLSLEEGI